MKSLQLLLSLFLFIGTFTKEQPKKLYCITPTATTNNSSCSKLAFYVQNFRQYFVSNTEIYFKDGEYHLNTTLSVTNVTNFSITGELNVTIRCQSAYILIADSALVEIKKIRFINCGLSLSNITNNAALILHNVISFRISNTTFQNCFGYAITGSNISR